MSSLFCSFLLLCSLLFCISPSTAETVPFRPKALVLPVFKDKCTNQYITQIKQRTPLVPVKLIVDLGARFMWVDCEEGYVSSSYTPVSCDSLLCKLANSLACATECNSTPKPGCHNNTCAHSPENPVIRLGTSGQIGQDVVSLQSFNGKTPDRIVSVPNFPFVCGPTFLLENLADGVTGLAGLGNSNISLPAQFSSAFGFPKKFAVCLSNSTKSNGLIFFGDGPYSNLPNDLTYTPLIHNPVSTAGGSYLGEASVEYFIGVKSIRIGGKDVKFNKTLLSIDSEGKGGTKISTVDPYTVLHTSIYKAVVKAFVKEMDKKFIPQVQPPIAPFGACFQSIVIDSNEFGPVLPFIDLVLEGQGSVTWRIWGANSMVKISSLVMCLGFVDGGIEPRTSIVIGGRQIEDNLLQFDLASSKLGFSSSLLVKNATCSNSKFIPV
eukprot:XP_002517163.2 basic 7S globulin [Ricinus communis]